MINNDEMHRLNIATFVLDDDQEILDLIEKLIDRLGITNYKLFTDESAFLTGLSEDVHVCVVDHILDTKTGLDILVEIKKKNKYSYVIVYTGIKNPRTIINYLNHDADKFVDKNESNHLEVLSDYLKEGLIIARDRIDFIEYLKSKAQPV